MLRRDFGKKLSSNFGYDCCFEIALQRFSRNNFQVYLGRMDQVPSFVRNLKDGVLALYDYFAKALCYTEICTPFLRSNDGVHQAGLLLSVPVLSQVYVCNVCM